MKYKEGQKAITRRGFISSSIYMTSLGAAIIGYKVPKSDIKTQILTLAAQAEKKCQQLQTKLKACASNGQDISLPDSSLAIAELFCRFCRKDAEDAQLNVSALRSIQYIHKMLDSEMKIAENVLAHKANYPLIPRWDAPDVTWRDGGFWSGGKPMFLTGMNWDAELAEKEPQLFKRLGFNLADSMFRGMMKPDGSFDDSSFYSGDGAYLRRLSKTGIPVDCLLDCSPPQWMLEKHPALQSPGYGNGVNYVLDDPLAIQYRHLFMDHYVPLYKQYPSFFAVDLANEPCFQGSSEILMGLWRAWLIRKYHDLNALNRAWGVNLLSLDDLTSHPAQTAPNPGIWWKREDVDLSKPGVRGELYDWCAFNNERISAYFKDLSDRIHARAPGAATHVKVMMGSYFTGSTEPRGWKMGLSYHTYGVDQEGISRSCSLLGGDLDIMDLAHVDKPNRRFGSVSYICGWIDAGMSADYLKSLDPNKPFYNSELHVTEDNTPSGDAEDAKAHIELALWLAHLHGMSAKLLWYWGRNGDGSIMGQGEEFFKGSVLQQPWLMHGYVRESLNMMRFVSPITSFARQPRAVRLLYSEASAIQDVDYLDTLRDAYESLNFLGVPIGFVTERQLAERGIQNGARLIIVPNAQYVQQSTINVLQGAAEKGVLTALIGENCMTREQTGALRSYTPYSGMAQMNISSPQAYHTQFEEWIRKAGIHRDAVAVDANGKPVWGVELRTSREDNRRYIYLVNLMRDPVGFKLKGPGMKGRFQDLRTGKMAGDSLTLAPRQLLFGEY
jgi:hypothetical protein